MLLAFDGMGVVVPVFVGVAVGVEDGVEDGVELGEEVGVEEGGLDGNRLGGWDGVALGGVEGCSEGDTDGAMEVVGDSDGAKDGDDEGAIDGALQNSSLGGTGFWKRSQPMELLVEKTGVSQLLVKRTIHCISAWMEGSLVSARINTCRPADVTLGKADVMLAKSMV